MRQVIYTSQATSPMSENEIIEMLKQAQKNNNEHGITGVLIFFLGRFVQYIEGEDQEVAQLVQNIQNDIRNTQLVILEDSQVDTRNFPDWSMGYQLYTEIQIKEKLPLFAIRKEEDFQKIRKQHKELHNFLVSLYHAPDSGS